VKRRVSPKMLAVLFWAPAPQAQLSP